jgi:hypothetical protein
MSRPVSPHRNHHPSQHRGIITAFPVRSLFLDAISRNSRRWSANFNRRSDKDAFDKQSEGPAYFFLSFVDPIADVISITPANLPV